MTQQDLPLRGGARTTDPQTSHAAAAKVNVNRLERDVLATLKANGPLTVSEIAAATRHPRDSLSPRMKRLVKLGLACDTGNTEIPSRFGIKELMDAGTRRFVKQTVWQITGKGVEIVAPPS